MALFINGVGQDTFNMNGVSIDNLYVDSVLVWSSGIEILSATVPNGSTIGVQLAEYFDDSDTSIPDLEKWEFTMDGVLIVPTEGGGIFDHLQFTFDTNSIYADTEVLVTLKEMDLGIRPVTDLLATNNSTVPAPTLMPKYEMTEPLRNDGTFDYVDDSNNPHIDLDGKLTESDGTTPYLPGAGYPQDGTLVLDNGRLMDTRYTMPDQKSVYGIYGADGSTVYNIYALEPVSPGIINVWEGDQDAPIVETHSDVAMELPTESWKITDAKPDFIPVVVEDTVYIAFCAQIPPETGLTPPDGITINAYLRTDTNSTVEHALQTIDDTLSEYLLRFDESWAGAAHSIAITGDESDAMTDYQMANTFNGHNAPLSETFSVYLPAGTHKVQITSGSGTAGGMDYTFNSETKSIVVTSPQKDLVEFDVVSTGAWYAMETQPTGASNKARVNGVNLIRTA